MQILFVCTGNVLRSMSAEYLLRDYLEKKRIHHILSASAGTLGEQNSPYAETVERLSHYGIDPSDHTVRKLSPRILSETDVVVAMAEAHRRFISEHFGRESVLFNELAYGRKEDVLDDVEFGERYGFAYDLKAFIYHLVDHLHEGMPPLVAHAEEIGRT